MIYKFKDFTPVIHKTAFVHQTASIIGNVTIGKNVYIGPGAAIRGDWGKIIISDGCNVQENCVIHMFPGTTVLLEESAHIGHGAIIHGATIKRNALVGMNAVIMDNAEVGIESIVGALTFVPDGMKIPKRKIAVGNPAQIIKDVTDDMAKWKTMGTNLYQQLPKECHKYLKEVSPLKSEPKLLKTQPDLFKTFKKTKKC